VGLSSWLARRASRATRVLVVEGADGFVVRVAVERAVLARGWRLAESPASADALLLAGRVVGELGAAVERVWDAMPGPRARHEVVDVAGVRTVLDEVVSRLVDQGAQAEDAAGRAAPDPAPGDGEDHEDHEGTDHGGMDHEDHAGMDHRGGTAGGGHGHMGHGDGDMAPDGIPLAGGSEEDRDGLEMDAVPVRLGPVLPYWPAGLVLDATLHGDLVVAAAARLVDGPAGTPDGEPPGVRAARRCDEVVAVGALAGWEQGAALARSARDALLDHQGDDARGTLLDLRHRAERSRLLRWSLGGVGEVRPEDAEELGLPHAVVGDCRDRLLRLIEGALAAARASAGTVPTADDGGAAPGIPATAFGPLVAGRDLAVVRLVVASLGTPAEVEVVAGA
jgi:hypothetical protein